jgi:hypothetical protein
MATGSLFLGINSSGGLDPACNCFLTEIDSSCMQFLCDTLRKKEKAQELDEKSIRASKIEVLWATLFLGSYLAPTLIFLYPAWMSLTKRYGR